MSINRTIVSLALAAAALPLVACNGSADPEPKDAIDTTDADAVAPATELAVKNATIRFSPVKGNPGAIYFKITGGPADTALTSVTVKGAERTEIHESAENGGVASMNKVDEIAVPAGQTVALAPGGYHVMIFGMEKPKGDTVPFTAIFSDGSELEANAQVTSLGMDMNRGKKTTDHAGEPEDTDDTDHMDDM